MIGVQEWIKDQVVFLTGGTGFIGKALIFKLLKLGCSKIYLTIRPKKGKSIEERLKFITEDYAYDSLRDKVDLNKVLIPIPLDYHAEDGLGISEEHRQLLWDEVTVVIHSAASITFGLPIKIIVLVNMKLTRDLLEFSKGMKNLKVFNHISTAFTSCEHMTKGVEEKMYEAKMDWRALISAAETCSDETLNLLELKLCGESPNTYVFSKHLAEEIAKDYSTVLPIVITRPGIVTNSVVEPSPGWLQNLNGPIAILIASAKGILRVVQGPSELPIAYVPVDYCVNGICCITWYKGTGQCTELTPVYSSKIIETPSVIFNEFEHIKIKTHPSYMPVWALFIIYAKHRYLFNFLHLILHLIPGLLVDSILRLLGKKPMLIAIYRKLYRVYHVLQPFMQNKQIFSSEKFEALMESIPENEKEVFPYYSEARDIVLHCMKITEVAYRIYAKEPPISEWDIKYVSILQKVHLVTKYLIYASILYYFPYNWIYSIGLYVVEYFIHFFDISRFQ